MKKTLAALGLTSILAVPSWVFANVTITPSTGFSIAWDGNDGVGFNAASPALAPANLSNAPGAAVFTSGDLGTEISVTFHVAANLNDSFYGNANSWIPGSAGATHYAAVRLAGLTTLTSVAFGRDNGNGAFDDSTPGTDCCGGQLDDRSLGLYTMQITTIAFPDGTTADTNNAATGWQTIGVLNYVADGDAAPGGAFTSYFRHEYDLGAGVQATGFRLLVPGDTAIDELELYGPKEAVLTILPSQGGTISGAGEYSLASTATIVASALPGYVFSRWTRDASGSENPLQVVMTQPKTVGAEFGQDTSDIDKDGLSGYDEVTVFGTNPAEADTDKDGLSDGEEAGLGIFIVVDGVFTWEQARADSVARGGRLATFGSALEWKGALEAIGLETLVGRIGVWIGATDQVQEGAWRWVTGEPFGFHNWADGKPDNAGDSDFAEVAGTELGAASRWYDRRLTAVRDGYLLEKGHSSSPVKADSDDDGLSDAEEKAAGSHPLMTDSDTDGLTDIQELRLSRTSPVNPDTDGDGQEDGSEDPDGDGLSNTKEIQESSTNPLLADTDGDGFNDSFELSSGFDPTQAASTPDAVSTILLAVEFRFNAAQGVSYRIEGSNDLQNWLIIEPSLLGHGGVVTRLYSTQEHPTRYLRVRRN
jgi:hypothetical protein